LYWAARIYRK